MEESSSLRSLKKMAKAMEKTAGRTGFGIDELGDDLLQNIIGRLPVVSFASAACVNRYWNFLCNGLLSSPKLSSAVSLNPSLENAVDEVMDKVLSDPIRPHFALASVCPSFSLEAAFQLIDGKFGSKIPVIVNMPEGILGRDGCTDGFVEAKWEVIEEEDQGAESPNLNISSGIMLTVGYLPGVKVNIIPLMSQHKGSRGFLVDEFVMDIRNYSSAVSGSTSPSGIIMFVDRKVNIQPVLRHIESAFVKNTFIVGDGGSKFLYRSDCRDNLNGSPYSACAAVALLLINRSKPLDVGKIQFHAMLSTGMSPIGPKYKAVSVKCNEDSTWLTASSETFGEHFDGQSLFVALHDEGFLIGATGKKEPLDLHFHQSSSFLDGVKTIQKSKLGEAFHDQPLYIGLTKTRRCSIEKEKPRRTKFLEFHEVLGGDEEYLFVGSSDIKTGDPFRFYIPDSDAAILSCSRVAQNLALLKADNRRKVFGGIVFSCCAKSFFGHSDVTSPFVENFPGVSFGGSYCAGEIGRGCLSLYDQDTQEDSIVSCSYHFHSVVYLVMSFIAPTPAQ